MLSMLIAVAKESSACFSQIQFQTNLFNSSIQELSIVFLHCMITDLGVPKIESFLYMFI